MMKLSDIADLNPRRMLKKGTVAPFVEMASLPVNARDIEHIGEKEFKSGGSKFKNDDVLFARITPCLENGKTAKVSGLADDEIAFGSTEFIVLSAKNSDDKDYLYYLARLPEFRAYAQARMEGTSGRQRVTWQSLSEFEFNFPEPEQRKRAGDLLKIFDNKIQLNTETNQTLEAIAQALFKSWFIDFDPVRAKAEALTNGKTKTQATIEAMKILSGKTTDQLTQLAQENPKDYQQLQTTAEAFPSGFDDTGIPLGWEMKPLSDLIKITGGGTPTRSNKDYWNGTIPWFSVKDIPAKGNIFAVDTEEKITELGLQKSSTKLLAKGTTIITARGTVGKLALLAKDMCMNQSCYGIKGNGVGDFYNYFNLKIAVDTLKKNTHGAVFDTITTKTFDTHITTFCNHELIEKFENSISALMEQIENNLYEINTLTNIRDILLPKLLSGEFDVSGIKV